MILLYYNKGNIPNQLEIVKKFLDKEATSYLETDNLTNQKCNGVTGIIVIGGDGTINRAVNQLNCFDLPIGIVPGGSGNDFIKSINIGKGLNEQIKTAVHGEVMAIDMGDCNGRLFVNGFGLGFDGQIAYEFDQNRTILKGHAAYYYHVLRILAGYKPRQLKFEIDGKGYEEKILLIAVSKGTTFGGGFKLTPHARLNDGKFAICLIKDLKPIKRFLNLGLLKDGTHSKLPEVELLKGTQIKIHRQENMIAHVDGEIVGRPPYELKIIDRKLRLRVGNTAFN